MADLMDLVQQRVDEQTQRYIQSARSRSAALSSFICEDCGDPIPEQRRIAVQGVELCITCQRVNELKTKRHKGY